MTHRKILKAGLGVLLVAALVTGALHFKEERAKLAHERVASERVREETKQHLAQLREETQQRLDRLSQEKDAIERTMADAKKQTGVLNEAVDASKDYERSQIEKGKRVRRIVAAVAAAQPIKVAVAEHYQSTGQWPKNNQDARLPAPDSFRDEVLRSVSVQPHPSAALIRVQFIDDAAVARQISLIANADAANQAVKWACTSPDIPDIGEIAPGCSFRAK